MDAVVLVSDFDQHAPAAIAALDRGLSVLSETAACRTVAEGVALVEAAGIQAMRSSLAGSLPVEVPDLRRPDVRRAHAADDWFPELPAL
jgi:uncharacterized protein (DUF1786 family)